VETAETSLVAEFLEERMRWFAENRPYIPHLVARWQDIRKAGLSKGHALLAIVRDSDLEALLKRMLDPREFLSDYGIRAVSRHHLEHPYRVQVNGSVHEVRYEPGESSTGLFGGNSNWRGPIWFPINFLLVEALQKFHHYYGDEFLVEYPSGSGNKRTLWQIAAELSRRLEAIFLRGEDGRRPVFGSQELFHSDPYWRDLVPFHEYFHGDSGRGVGASHQTGWTGVVAKLLEQTATQMHAPRPRAGAASDVLVEVAAP
jgi:hypothetical protein